MNRTALSVISLAVGSVLIIGLFNIYKPQTKRLASQVFHKPQVALEHSYMNAPKNGAPVTNKIEYYYNGAPVKDNNGTTIGFTAKGKFNEKNNIGWYDWGYNKMPGQWNIWSMTKPKDPSQDFSFGPNGTVQHVLIRPNPIDVTVKYVNNNNQILGSFVAHKLDKNCYDNFNHKAMNINNYQVTVTKDSPNFPKGYHLENNNKQTFSATYDSNNYTVKVDK